MRKRLINGEDFTAMVISAAALLRQRAEEINKLNVFPVPDGDTGSNMSRTMQAGMQRITAKRYDEVGQAAKALAEGMLMGARGNSGVILSQLFQGFAKTVEDKLELTVNDWAEGLQAGVEAAYRAVANPVEGTVLTVARKAAAFGLSTASGWDDPEHWWAGVVEKAKMALEATPEQLPILKQAGVVDSGGQGLVYVYEGFLAACRGESIESDVPPDFASAEIGPTGLGIESTPIDEIEHFYDMEFFIRFNKRSFSLDDEAKLRNQLTQIGDSVLVISGEELVKVHVHSRSPGDVLNLALAYGELTQLHVENMRDQHHDWVKNYGEKQHEQVVVAVSAGEGISEIFRSLGASGTVSGGQSMNPSVEELLQAVNDANAETVFLLANNKNIQLAAERTAELSNGKVIVIPTATIPQGMTAMLAFDKDQSVVDNQQAMTEAIASVKSGYVTYAVKESVQNELAIKAGDLLGVYEGQIVSVNQDLDTVCRELLDQMIDEHDELVTVLYGQEMNKDKADLLINELEGSFSSVEFELLQGGQPLHYYIFSVE